MIKGKHSIAIKVMFCVAFEEIADIIVKANPKLMLPLITTPIK